MTYRRGNTRVGGEGAAWLRDPVPVRPRPGLLEGRAPDGLWAGLAPGAVVVCVGLTARPKQMGLHLPWSQRCRFRRPLARPTETTTASTETTTAAGVWGYGMTELVGAGGSWRGGGCLGGMLAQSDSVGGFL